ncbi:MAG: hypothetical protein JO234_12110 [Hyphomicrobiales bacterium]|nr:hypothetical protein [Hyphomicrobiales bacterium]
MLKKLAAIGLGAALILAPVASMAQTSDQNAAPAAGAPASDQGAMKAPAPKKHKMKKHSTTKKHSAKKPAAAPAPAATDAPKS